MTDIRDQVRIERYADQGRCIAHIDGRVVFVRFALPGELVRISIDEPHMGRKRFWTGEVIEVLEPSEHRVTPPWPLAGPLAQGGGVGGADLIHVDRPGQLEWKSVVISEQMRRLGHVQLDDVPVRQADDDDQLAGLHWRTRIDLIADAQGRPSMRRRGSHERVPLTTMPLASRTLLEVATRENLWRRAFEPGARLRVTVPEPRSAHADHVQAQELIDAVDGNMSLLTDGKVLAGTEKVSEEVDVAGTTFSYQVDAAGFWQVHRQAPTILVGDVLHLVRGSLGDVSTPVIWDLYSGSGLFTLPLAALIAGARVLSIEGERHAVANAKYNLAHAGLDDVAARVGDVQTALRYVPKALAHPDAVVLDPPRAGANAGVCTAIAQAEPALVVYVACDPTSLARDTAIFLANGYRLDDIHAFDIYPMTHHVETVAMFVRERSSRVSPSAVRSVPGGGR